MRMAQGIVTCHYAMVEIKNAARKMYSPDGIIYHHLCQRLKSMARAVRIFLWFLWFLWYLCEIIIIRVDLCNSCSKII